MEKKVTNQFKIPHKDAWLRPDRAFFHAQDMAAGIAVDEIEWNGKYKGIRELRDIAIFGLAFCAIQKYPCFVQMNTLSDSPDAFLARVVSDETYETAPVEITFYGRSRIGSPDKPLEDRLSELGGKFYKLPEKYWLLIHIGKKIEVDHKAIADKLHAIDAKFNVFSIQEVSDHPDTIARFVAYNPILEAYDINVGGICSDLSQTNIPGDLTINKGKMPHEIGKDK